MAVLKNVCKLLEVELSGKWEFKIRNGVYTWWKNEDMYVMRIGKRYLLSSKKNGYIKEVLK